MKNLLSSLLFAAFAFLTLSAEECGKTHYISDSGFDIWCGDRLCDWELESGSVARAPSWHKEDYAVELIGDDVVISQLSTRGSTSCLRFELLADIEDNARVTLTMDFFDDGVVDYTQELAHVRWESLAYYVTTPASWRGVRFTLHKEGPGRARLAQIEATADDACIDKAIEILDKPMGADCSNGVECASGWCEDSPSAYSGKVCSGCAVDADCDAGEVCGVDAETRFYLGPARTCIAEGSRPLGSLCIGNAECRLGNCFGGICSECLGDSDCTTGELCQAPAHPSLSASRVAHMCSGGAPGSVCTQDSNCDSNLCMGGDALTVCDDDGRDCRTDEDCPGFFVFESAHCVLAGIDPGICQ